MAVPPSLERGEPAWPPGTLPDRSGPTMQFYGGRHALNRDPCLIHVPAGRSDGDREATFGTYRWVEACECRGCAWAGTKLMRATVSPPTATQPAGVGQDSALSVMGT